MGGDYARTRNSIRNSTVAVLLQVLGLNTTAGSSGSHSWSRVLCIGAWNA